MVELSVLLEEHWIPSLKIRACFTMIMCYIRKRDSASQNPGFQYLTRGSTFAGVVLASDEGKHIAAALGKKKAVLLGNHGLLTAGRSIEETVAYFVLLEKCCEVQLAADASSAGTGKPLVMIGEAEAQSTWEAVGTKENGYCKFRAMWEIVRVLISYSSRTSTLPDSGARIGAKNISRQRSGTSLRFADGKGIPFIAHKS